MLMSDPNRIIVGSISGAYGVRGEVRVKSFTAAPEDIETYSPLTSADGTPQFTLALLNPIKNGFVARIAEIATKEEADALKGVQLFAPRDHVGSVDIRFSFGEEVSNACVNVERGSGGTTLVTEIPFVSVPALSVWGLVVLTLALTAGVIVVARRSRVSRVL